MPLAIDYPRLPPGIPWEEPTVPPFHATLRRRQAVSLRQGLARPRRRRWAGVAALSALALAGPLGWDGLMPEPASARTATAPVRLSFETPGETFPGSAFYFLAPDAGVIPAAQTAAVGVPSRPLDPRLGDAAPRPMFLAGTAQDRFRALHCLTTAIYYEAATEPDAGQRAVAQVVLNRVAHPQWPDSVCGVVYQGSDRPGCQFSFACDGSLGRAPARMWWLRARAVAERALAGDVYAPVGLATYYHTGAVNPRWAPKQTFVGAIGAHLFYRPPGAEGRLAAFSDRYLGGEPPATPLVPALRTAAAVPFDPAPAGRSIPAWTPLPSTSPSPQVAPTPPPLPDLLPPASAIRPEYRNSGRWIASPTS